MKSLLYSPAQILTCKPTNGKFKRLEELNDLSPLENYSLILEDELITDIVKNQIFDFSEFDLVIDCRNKVVMPGLIDSHTHLIFSGSRADEFEMRVSGKSYEEIARAGGGINKTVTATRQISKEKLVEISKERLLNSLSFGITTIEIKSGYGLDWDTEIKMLEVAKEINSLNFIEVISTFLGAHIIPPEYILNRNDYIKLLVEKLIPEVTSRSLAKFCDVFLEKTAFSLDETNLILNTAKSYGMELKLHCDQFNSMGGVQLGIDLDVKSIDHLEMIRDEDIERLSKTDIVATILPGVSYFLKIPFSPARKMIDSGCIIAIATDFNPGSCTSQNLPLMMNIASLYNGMKLNETINAATINAAYSLGLEEKVGSIEIGKQADLLILNTPNYKDLVYYFGSNLIKTIIKKGRIIYERNC